MRVIKKDFKRVWREIGKVIGREFLEGGDQVVGSALIHGSILVGLKLMLSGEDIHCHRKQAGQGLEDDHK